MWLRFPLTLIAALGGTLIAYGGFYTHFSPRAKVGDHALALQMIPLELLVGILFGAFVFRLFGRRFQQPNRADSSLRMLYRLAHRMNGIVDLNQLERTPLEPQQVRDLLNSLEGQGKAVALGNGRYQLS
jgi:hypothetical protein